MKRKKSVHLYVIHETHPESRRLVKIGRAFNPEKRLAEIKVGNANDVEMAVVLPGMGHRERETHGMFSGNAGGEWYSPTPWLLSWVSAARLAAQHMACDWCGEIHGHTCRDIERVECDECGIPLCNSRSMLTSSIVFERTPPFWYCADCGIPAGMCCEDEMCETPKDHARLLKCIIDAEPSAEIARQARIKAGHERAKRLLWEKR